eukprot:COSAG01_NODE_48148_length_383_cov_5.355634_2_plen_27_part_01
MIVERQVIWGSSEWRRTASSEHLHGVG